MQDPSGLRSHRSFKLTGFGQPLAEMTGQVEPPRGSEVLVAIRACGVCHSDLHIADGFFELGAGKRLDLSKGIGLPRTLGHEIAGEVVALGPEATGVRIGDQRVVYPWIGCGGCGLCRSGQEHLCARPATHGAAVDGGFSNFVTVPHPRYLLDFGTLPATYAATLACSGLTAFSALRKAGPISELSPLLLIGAGGVGLSAISISRALHGTGPIVADIDPLKRQSALDAGASEAVDPGDPETRRWLAKQTDGGFSAAIDFVGSQSSAEFGLSLLRKGGRLIAVGLFGGALELSLPLLPLRSIGLVGSYVGSLDEMNELMALARAGKLEPTKIETHPLSQAQATMEALRAGRVVGRAVLTP